MNNVKLYKGPTMIETNFEKSGYSFFIESVNGQGDLEVKVQRPNDLSMEVIGQVTHQYGDGTSRTYLKDHGMIGQWPNRKDAAIAVCRKWLEIENKQGSRIRAKIGDKIKVECPKCSGSGEIKLLLELVSINCSLCSGNGKITTIIKEIL